MLLIEEVRRTIRRHGLLPPGSRVAVALSGGADSVALLVVLRDLAASEGFQLAGAVHLNHQLRGADADADEAFCRRLAADLELPIDVEAADIAGRARAAGLSIEHAAHDAREEFYVRAAGRLSASAVAVAHTRDDQAETFLLRLLRGAGPRGLGGMHPRSGIVVRPLVETAREDVRAFARARGLRFCEDVTNADTSIPRNRIRHELMPFLETRFSPGIVGVLAREAAIAREDAEYLDAAAREWADRLLVPVEDGVALSRGELAALPTAITRRVIRLAQQRVAPGHFVGFDAVDAVLRLVVSNSSGPVDLPGHRVTPRGDRVVFASRAGRTPARAARAFAYPLPVPGRVAVPEAGCAIAADLREVPPGRTPADLWTLAARGEEAVLEAARIAAPLAVRNRRPGDRYQPLGLQGHKKLQDLFVDAKIARAERDRAPVVVDADGRILWVAGHALAEEFRVTDGTRAVVILKRVRI